MPVSLLDNDLYKFSMQQLYPKVNVSYAFNNRSRTTHIYTQSAYELLQTKINDLSSLSLTTDEIEWLTAKCDFFTPEYIKYLASFRFDPKRQVSLAFDQTTSDLTLTISGVWHDVILYEVPILSLVTECFFESVDTHWTMDGQEPKAEQKCERLLKSGVQFSDFGTRRRRNFATHDLVVSAFKKTSLALSDAPGVFLGTSNMFLAMRYDLKPLGTVAHEWTMALTVLEKSVIHANRNALEKWLEINPDYFKIALTDTYGTALFFKDFDITFANAYAGVRHDSGDPFVFADTVTSHYASLGVDPSTKVMVFSDGLDVEKCVEIKRYVDALCGCRCMFGVGTHFTNDFEGSKAMSCVIKLSVVEGEFVVKLSDDDGKHQGDGDKLKEVIELVQSV